MARTKKHTLRMLSSFGDSEVCEWSPNIPIEIKSAEDTFKALQARGAHFFDASQPAETKDELIEFDPQAKDIIGFTQLTAG